MLPNNQTRIRGYVPHKIKPIEPNGADLVQNVLNINSLLRDLEDFKGRMTQSINDKVLEINDAILELGKEIDRLKKQPAIKGEDGKSVDENKIIGAISDKIPNNLIQKIDKVLMEFRNLPNLENRITDRVLNNIPRPERLDKEGLIKDIVSRIPRSKSDLKVVQERFEVDPMSVIDKILKLADEGKLKLKTSHIDGLEQTIRAFQSQIGARGYLHGGGDTVSAGSNIVITTNPNGTKVISTTGALSSLIATGPVDGSNINFSFVSKPTYIISDGAWYTENKGWSWNAGTLTATMIIPPNDNIFGFS